MGEGPVVVIDNYDSFTYNLVQMLGELGADPLVFRNDRVGVDELVSLAPAALVVSPGPCTPREAGVSVEAIRALAPSTPILGVCLGHQCIAEAFGGRVGPAERLMHGKRCRVTHDGQGIYKGSPSPFWAGRYHSLAVIEAALPPELVVSARSETGEVMGIRHRRLWVEGVQFHPESVLTEEGYRMLSRLLEAAGIGEGR